MYVTISLFATVLFATVFNFCTSETIFIKTNSSSDHQCPAEPCLTLQEFVSHHHHVESNTVLKFLPGNHVLLFATNKRIIIRNVENVTLTGVSDQQSSLIHCVSEFSVTAINVQNLTIARLHLFGCGAPKLEEITDADDRSNVTLFFVYVFNVNIWDTHIHDSKEAGMYVISGFNLTLNRTSFVGNRPNCVFMFVEKNNSSVKHASNYIVDSQFAFGRSNDFYHGGGLSLIFFQTSYTVYVNITDVALHSNNGGYGGNFLALFDEWSYKYTIVRAEKIRSSNFSLWSAVPALSGFAVWQVASFDSANPHQENLQCEHIVHILDSCFEAGMGIFGVEVKAYQADLRIRFTNVSIKGYHKAGTCGMKISDIFLVILDEIEVTSCKVSPIQVKNSTVIMRTILVHENEGNIFGAVALHNSKITFLGSAVFIQNYGYNCPVLYAHSSTLIFLGKVEFVNNTGYNGGGLALYAGSQILIGSQAHVTFLGNHANHFGGAIFVQNTNYLVLSHFHTIVCFYRFSDTFTPPRVVFENNTAEYAGSALYGGWIDFCKSLLAPNEITPDFDIVFQVNGGESDPSVIASNPLRVCLCVDSRPECSISQYNISAYPGTTIQTPAVAVGQRFGTVPSTIRSDFLYTQINEAHPKIEDWQHTQKVEKRCTNLTYTIMSPPQMKLTMEVKVDNLDIPDRNVMQVIGANNLHNKPDLYFINWLINIEMLPCPLGFEYHNRSMTCTCDSKLVENEINCSIDTQTVWRKSSFWITAAEESGELIVHEHCPFDYCKPESFDLDLEYPDEQCAFHRSGILCGACQNNLSHVFGTSQCRECLSLWALLWVPVIALAGIALVVLLIMLNLTVSVGTINGLIFYANIVRANHATFFPHNTTNSFLSWFIAWINLDLGIETCFYNGLDAYVKTWLQFVFPLYIWFLVITIIVLSHYYTLAARLSGRNAVPVLATLFLLSYAKLLRIIITVFQSAELEYPDNTVRKIWLYDGNVDYLEGKHIPLFIAALLLLLISLPYTTVLIFIQHLQHWSSYRVLFWVKKLKPLFDAYTGPYKDKHRYWTGLLLLVRVVLFLIFSMNIRGSANINLLAIIVTVLTLFMHSILAGSVYKKWYLNMIEYSLFLNLGVLASATLYTSTVIGQGQTAVAYTSVSIAFVLFIIIVVFHILTKLKSTQHYNWISVNIVRKLRVKLSKLRSALKKLCCKERSPRHNTQPRVTHATVELRESLLEYCS